MYRLGILTLILVCGAINVGLVFLLRSIRGFVIIETEIGLIKGYKSNDGDFSLFLGIPYGKVNESNLFGAVIPHPNFNHTFDANNGSVKCPQMINGVPEGTANCLQLDIFVPKSASQKHLLPVMVWIHGGEFESGHKANLFGPKHLVKHNVILVRINYRLGAYGFMCLDIPEVPGNQGLKDQVLALKWIKKHIKGFGGDNDKITVFGSNAGAHSIDFHILSENKKLFNSAILQSGSSLVPPVFIEHDANAPIRIAQELGFITNSMGEAITFLSSVNTSSIILTCKLLELKFKPCKEKKFDDVEPFLTNSWITLDTPKAKDMSILIGFSEHELLYRYVNISRSNPSTIIQDRLVDSFDFDDKRMNEMENLINDYYFSGNTMSSELIFSYTNFDSDFTYIHPIRRSIKKFLDSKAINVFYYMFSYNGERNIEKTKRNINIGSAIHGDEIGYLFDVKFLAEILSPEDELTLNRLTTMWTNFAKHSDPTPSLSNLLPVKWTPITNGSYHYILLNSTLTSGQEPFQDRMDFWDSFYLENEIYQKGYEGDRW